MTINYTLYLRNENCSVRCMLRLLLSLMLFFIVSCGTKGDKGREVDPKDVHPPAEAVPDSMQINKDSTIVPDSVTYRQ